MRSLRYVGVLALLLFVVAAFTPLANLLNIRMAGIAQLEPSDAIVVLGRGGADSDGVLTNRSLRRVLHGIELYKHALAPFLVLSGSTAEMNARLALARGLAVPESAILTAGVGFTTRDEAAQVSRLLLPAGRRHILLVADPIDMPRSRALFERAGFTVLAAPTPAGGPSSPESRLSLTRDVATELLAWAYHRLASAL
jgi:uncharacterized SAM-binding protein YcdF (DUF218 family)